MTESPATTGISTDAWGVDSAYEDTEGIRQPTTARTRKAVREAMGSPPGNDPAGASPVVIFQGDTPVLSTAGSVVLENGAECPVSTVLPANLPLGYHHIHLDGQDPRPLIVCPRTCFLPPGLRWGGWAVQLYSARSGQSWGIGDLQDLKRLGSWSRDVLKNGFVLLNPLSAPAPVTPQESSPYFPSSRRFLNPLYLAVEKVPGAEALGAELDPIARAGRDMNRDRRIDRDCVWRLKRRALEKIWKHAGPHDSDEMDAGSALTSFARYCTIAEIHGSNWRQWPSPLRHPDTTSVADFAQAHEDRVNFYRWLQINLDRQLADAADQFPLVRDLPVGVNPAGADAWAWQDSVAVDASVGAPPDPFNAAGQSWGLAPFIPHRLRETGYAPFIETLRAVFRHSRGLRIDHIMSLFRLFWIPAGLGPQAGAYVRYPARDLLAILALESHRAGAIVVGEDLGTVEPGVRERLAARNVLSYRLLWFETSVPESYPAMSLASVTTHDLPTIAGVWTGHDFKEQQDLGLQVNEEEHIALRARLRKLTGLSDSSSTEAVTTATYARLASCPSMLVTATLEDAAGVRERPNVPGTLTERANWSLALPQSLEELLSSDSAAHLAQILSER